jgi:hypothetical protein
MCKALDFVQLIVRKRLLAMKVRKFLQLFAIRRCITFWKPNSTEVKAKHWNLIFAAIQCVRVIGQTIIFSDRLASRSAALFTSRLWGIAVPTSLANMNFLRFFDKEHVYVQSS